MVKFSAMIEDDDAAWLETEAKLLDRSQAFVIRKAINTVRMVRVADGAEFIGHAVAPAKDAGETDGVAQLYGHQTGVAA
jgi:hypothetical protein